MEVSQSATKLGARKNDRIVPTLGSRRSYREVTEIRDANATRRSHSVLFILKNKKKTYLILICSYHSRRTILFL